MEYDQRGENEEQHRRQRVSRPQFEQKILARQRTDVGEVHHARASFDVAKRSMRRRVVCRDEEHATRAAVFQLTIQ